MKRHWREEDSFRLGSQDLLILSELNTLRSLIFLKSKSLMVRSVVVDW